MRRVWGAVLLLGMIGGCTPSAERVPVAAATPAPVAETAAGRCLPSLLPSGFHRDDSYSGDLSPSQYSASADVQAALEYDRYQSGYRTVLTDLRPGASRPGAVFASCVSMRFAGDAEAARFLSSYRDLRSQAGNLARTIQAGQVGSLTDLVAYHEQGQDFRAYGVTGADVIELAGRAGPRLFIATVAGSAPDLAQARALTAAMLGG
jgi:hypothetical protein